MKTLMNRNHILLYIVGILVVSVCCVSCDKTEKCGSIMGIVTDKDTSEPMANVWIELNPGGNQVLTGSDGQYGFKDVTEGDYTIFASKQGYLDDTLAVTVRAGGMTKGDIKMSKPTGLVTIVDDNGQELTELNFGEVYNEASILFSIVNNGTVRINWNISLPDNIVRLSRTSGEIQPGKSYAITAKVSATNLTTNYTSSMDINWGTESLQLIIRAKKVGNVSTLAIEDIKDTCAVFKGKIHDASNFTERGFVYSNVNPNPRIDDGMSEVVSVPGMGNGTFTKNVGNLVKGNTYYVCAYAKSNDNAEYGDVLSFKTERPPYVILEVENLMIQTEDLGYLSWGDANRLCENSTVAGYTDWRLPTVGELIQMYNKKDIIGGFKNDKYWSSEYNSYYGDYYYINFSNGSRDRGSSKCYVRAVRSLTEE